MKIRPWAEFSSDLPDDHIENERGDEIVQFGGKSVAKAIADMLTQIGCEVSEPIYADENGWEPDICVGERRRRLWCQVTLIGKYAMVFVQNSWIADILGRYHQDYLDVLASLADALAIDSRFHDVRWFTSEELHTAALGASRPIEA